MMGKRSLKQTMSEDEYYLSLYQRHADNVAQSEMAKATAGRGIPQERALGMYVRARV